MAMMAMRGRAKERRAEDETQAYDEVVENDHLRLHRRDRRTSPEVRQCKFWTRYRGSPSRRRRL